jgi:hypothetical protein
MTTNAIFTYLGIALACSAAVFGFLGIRRPRGESMSVIQEYGEPPRNDLVALATTRANMACGALLLALAVFAELISFVQGGPGYGEPSGNVPGGILAIALATFLCLAGCLVARQFILRRLSRKLAERGR